MDLSAKLAYNYSSFYDNHVGIIAAGKEISVMEKSRNLVAFFSSSTQNEGTIKETQNHNNVKEYSEYLFFFSSCFVRCSDTLVEYLRNNKQVDNTLPWFRNDDNYWKNYKK